jgi:hypothetical protein
MEHAGEHVVIFSYEPKPPFRRLRTVDRMQRQTCGETQLTSAIRHHGRLREASPDLLDEGRRGLVLPISAPSNEAICIAASPMPVASEN